MTNKPSVAAIIPNYNHARFLRERIDSVLNQGVLPDRIVILDDCSTDESQKIIEEYAEEHPIITFVPAKSNSGDTFAQWNKGINLVAEDYVWIAESDDWAEPDFIYELLKLAIATPDAGILYCNSDLIDEGGKKIGSTQAHYADLREPERWQNGFTNNGKQECRDYLIHRNTIPNASACLFRRENLKSIGLASDGYRLCGDWITYARLLLESDIAYSPKTLNHYRVHNQTVRSSSQKALVEISESYRVLNYLRENCEIDTANLEEARIRIFERLHFLFSAADQVAVSEQWGRIFSEAIRFDPDFEQRLANPFAHTFHNVVVYYDENGSFSETKHKLSRISPKGRRSLVFGDCNGRVRFDPVSRPGIVRIRSFAIIEQSTNQILWAANESTGFEGVQAAGTCKVLRREPELVLYSHGPDPQLILNSWHQSANYDPGKTFAFEVDMEVGAQNSN